MEIIKFSKYKLNENLDDKVKDKLSNTYKSLKRGVILIIEQSLPDNEKENIDSLKKVLKDIREKEIDNLKLEGLIENSDIYNFYLKYQNDIDELLKDEKYFEITPKENVIYSLYDFVIDGTKKAINFIVEIIEKEIEK